MADGTCDKVIEVAQRIDLMCPVLGRELRLVKNMVCDLADCGTVGQCGQRGEQRRRPWFGDQAIGEGIALAHERIGF